MNLRSHIESLLFISGRPLGKRKLRDLTGADEEAIESELEELARFYESRGAGIRILKTSGGWQMATAKDCARIVSKYVKDETSGELTKPQLETLAIISYRGPVTKYEIEQIRGVNSALILRNLLIRGLIEEETDPKTKISRYFISHEFLRFLGVKDVCELPNFKELGSPEVLLNLFENQDIGTGESS